MNLKAIASVSGIVLTMSASGAFAATCSATSCSELAALCATIDGATSLSDRSRNSLITKSNDAGTKITQGKLGDADAKLDDIDQKIHEWDDAPKPKISSDDFDEIHAGVEAARVCTS